MFSRPGVPFFRYDGGDCNLVPLYLVTQKGPEDENFRVGTISYGLQSVVVRIETCIETCWFKILGPFRGSVEGSPEIV
jgi:hypothetical protein